MSDLPQDTGEEGDESEVQIVAEIKNKPPFIPPAGILILPQEVQSQVLKFMMRNVEGTSETTGGAESYDNVDPVASRMHQQQQAFHFVDQTGDMQMQVRVEDAMKYLDKIKVRYNYRPEVYDSFLEIMKDFKAQSIQVPCVIKRVVDLFKGHEDLILGFNVFLPHGSRITSANPKGTNEMNSTTAADNSKQCNSPRTYFVEIDESPSSIPVSSSLQSGTGGMVPPNRPHWYGHRVMSSNLTSFPPHASRLSLLANNHAIMPYLAPPSPRFLVRHNHSTPISNEYAQSQGNAHYAMDVNHYANEQPEEYNQALYYVNKIKNRLQNEKYKEFLEILHEYRKEQRRVAESPNSGRKLSEHDIYCKVSKLFENHSDLLEEFTRYINTSPDVVHSSLSSEHVNVYPDEHMFTDAVVEEQETQTFVPVPYPSVSSMPKQLEVETSKVTTKRVPCKSPAKVSKKKAKLQELAWKTSLDFEDFDFENFMEKNVQEAYPLLYEDILRVLFSFNAGIFSKAELILTLTMLLREYPKLLKWLKHYIDPWSYTPSKSSSKKLEHVEDNSRDVTSTKIMIKEVFDILELDPSVCRRLGHSYGRIPLEKYSLPKCSGRTALCDEVLNDEWFSYPAWTEPAALCVSKKMPYEEIMYKCEEERFELDFVVQTTRDLIKILEYVTKQMDVMTTEQLDNFTLDDCLGGQSTIHIRTVRRIYGEEKTDDIIEGLKQVPKLAVPLVLKRLKQKDWEWTNVQKESNKMWEEQVKRYYLRSLDHMGAAFKQSDAKAIRPKSLLTEIETLHKKVQMSELNVGRDSTADMSLDYKDLSVFTDACRLLLHSVRRLSSIRSEDKRKVKEVLRQFLPNLFLLPEMAMSDDEDNESSKDSDQKIPVDLTRLFAEVSESPKDEIYNENDAKHVIDAQAACSRFDNFEKNRTENCRVFFANHRWYVFLRLHHILCDRLTKIREIAVQRFNEFKRESSRMKKSGAYRLRKLSMDNLDDVAGYYPTFLESVMDLVDGNLESIEFEDQIRYFFGINAYFAFTIEKIVSSAVSQLQFFVSEVACRRCVELFKEASLVDVTLNTEPCERLQAYSSKALVELGKDVCVRVVIDASKYSRQMTMKWIDENSKGTKETENIVSDRN